MANLDDMGGFDSSTVEPAKGFGLMDKGWQEAWIIDSERKKTNSGTGEYVSLKIQIITGKYQNRLMWLNLNLWNSNEEAVKIAKGQLSAICRAVGVPTLRDTSELHDKPMRILIGQKKNKASGDIENNINDFEPRAAGPVAIQPVQTQQPAMAGAGAGSAKPW